MSWSKIVPFGMFSQYLFYTVFNVLLWKATLKLPSTEPNSRAFRSNAPKHRIYVGKVYALI